MRREGGRRPRDRRVIDVVGKRDLAHRLAGCHVLQGFACVIGPLRGQVALELGTIPQLLAISSEISPVQPCVF
jgi:hypothetical protein